MPGRFLPLDLQHVRDTWLAVREGNGDVHGLVATYDNLELNEDRHAVQILGCDLETVVAHIPFPREVSATDR
jgi:hypothetical protein